MKSIPNLEMPPQATASPKADTTEKLEVSGKIQYTVTSDDSVLLT